MCKQPFPLQKWFIGLAFTGLACGLLAPGAQALVTGQLQGSVADGDGNPVGGIVLLFKPAEGSNSGLVRKVKVDKKGTFKQPFFPTGQYKIESGDQAWFVKYMKVVVRDSTNLELNSAEGAAHPVEGLPPITVTGGLKVLLELTVVGGKEKQKLVQQFSLQESSGDLKESLELVQKDEFEKAVTKLEGILGKNPDLGAAHYLKGQALYRMGRYEEANACYLRTLELDKEQPGVHGNLALSLLQQGEAMASSGDEEGAAARFRESVNHFDQAAQEDPGNLAILTSRAAALDRAGDPDRLVQALRGILEQDPGQLTVRLRLADLLTKSGEGNSALEVLEGAGSDNPDVANGLFNVAVRFYNDGELDSAMLAAEKAIAVNPYLAPGYRLLGRAKMSMGDKEGAIAALEKFLELAPGDPTAETERKLIAALKAE